MQRAVIGLRMGQGGPRPQIKMVGERQWTGLEKRRGASDYQYIVLPRTVARRDRVNNPVLIQF